MTNPLAQPSPLPYELPQFELLTPELMEASIVEGMEIERAEWEQIATSTEPATVENTVEALERAGELLTRANAVFWNLAGAVGGAAYDEAELRLAPLLAAHTDAYLLDERLYERIKSVDLSAADAETKQWVSEQLREFERGGIALSAADKDVLRGLNAQLAGLEAEYQQKVVAGLKESAVELSAAEVETLDESARAALAATAAEAGHGEFLTSMDNPTVQAIVASLPSAQARARVHAASISRGASGEADTRELVLKIVRLRDQAAKLLGFANHAALAVDEEGARTTKNVMGLLGQLVEPARTKLRAERAELAKVLAKAGEIDGVEAFALSDWARAETLARKERFELNDDVLRPYFELGSVIENGVFYAANLLYGLSFERREDLKGWADDVIVWEVKDEAGNGIGLFLGDFYTRDGKAGGAWMNNLVEQSHLEGTYPVVVNCQNIARPGEGQPTLLTFDEVTTAFHEFGHALNGLLSNCKYASLAGANTSRDFVELPSQFNENWATHPRVLANYARHIDTGEVLPAELVERLTAMAQFGQGYATSEYLAASLLDQGWHQLEMDQLPVDAEGVLAKEDELLRQAGFDPSEVVARYRTTYFPHTFAGGYDARYWAYIWAEVLAADAVAWFRSEGEIDGDGGLNREAGRRFAAEVLSRGNTRPTQESYRAFAGRDAEVKHLLAKRGLA
ncbi:M3 family metallopeptidase [Buchananella felis]|uniref:M3 family metallopeptidase n=1 Tax=Buchananella felis TaxID=3231492 RepID=UPI0035275ED3